MWCANIIDMLLGKSCVLPSLPWHDSWFEIDVAAHFWSNPKFKRCRLWRDVGIFDTQHVAEWEMLATFFPLLKALRILIFQQLPDFRISPMSMTPHDHLTSGFTRKACLVLFSCFGGGDFIHSDRREIWNVTPVRTASFAWEMLWLVAPWRWNWMNKNLSVLGDRQLYPNWWKNWWINSIYLSLSLSTL